MPAFEVEPQVINQTPSPDPDYNTTDSAGQEPIPQVPAMIPAVEDTASKRVADEQGVDGINDQNQESLPTTSNLLEKYGSDAIGFALELLGATLEEIARNTDLLRALEELVIQYTIATGVWSKVEATQDCYPETLIPKSFTMNVEGIKFWIHPNATKHMVELIAPEVLPNVSEEVKIKMFKESLTHGIPPRKTKLIQAIILSDLYTALKELVKNGIPIKQRLIVSDYEIEVGLPRVEGGALVVIHALNNKFKKR